MHIYVRMCVRMCVCLCVCVCTCGHIACVCVNACNYKSDSGPRGAPWLFVLLDKAQSGRVEPVYLLLTLICQDIACQGLRTDGICQLISKRQGLFSPSSSADGFKCASTQVARAYIVILCLMPLQREEELKVELH